MGVSQIEWEKRRATWLIGSVLSVLTVTILLNMPPMTGCGHNLPVSGHQHWFNATEIVVQPWRGEHHVYGVFTIPVQYQDQRLYSARLTIKSLSNGFPEVSPESGKFYDERVDTAHYRMRVYFPTRMALWFLLTGRFGDLTMPCHWWLAIQDR